MYVGNMGEKKSRMDDQAKFSYVLLQTKRKMQRRPQF